MATITDRETLIALVADFLRQCESFSADVNHELEEVPQRCGEPWRKYQPSKLVTLDLHARKRVKPDAPPLFRDVPERQPSLED